MVSGRSDFPGLTYKSGPLCSAPVWPGVTGHTARTWKESSEQMCCSHLVPDPITMGDAKLHALQGEIMFFVVIFTVWEYHVNVFSYAWLLLCLILLRFFYIAACIVVDHF